MTYFFDFMLNYQWKFKKKTRKSHLYSCYNCYLYYLHSNIVIVGEANILTITTKHILSTIFFIITGIVAMFSSRQTYAKEARCDIRLRSASSTATRTKK